MSKETDTILSKLKLYCVLNNKNTDDENIEACFKCIKVNDGCKGWRGAFYVFDTITKTISLSTDTTYYSSRTNLRCIEWVRHV